MTPEQAQSRLCALLDARQTAFRSLIARCETGEPFMREYQEEFFDIAVQSLDVDLGFIRHMAKTSRPLIPIPELMAMAERVVARLQDLVQRVCG